MMKFWNETRWKQGLYRVAMVGCIGWMAWGCRDEATDSVSTVSFQSTTSSATEGDGTVTMQVAFSQAASADTQLNFSLSGDAALNGDYTLVTTSPLTIAAGATSASIQIKLIDESIIETEDDHLVVTLTAAGTGLTLGSSTQLVHTLTITDNDQAPDQNLQMDLTWSLGEGVDIDNVNLDLYLANQVVISENSVTSANLYTASENGTGFETVTLTADEPDDEYYMVVVYSKGSATVDYRVNVNGSGMANVSIDNTLTADDAGYGYFYGPLKKSGSTYGRVAQPTWRRMRLD